MKNRLNEINKKILNECKNINDIEKSIPFIHELLDIENEKNMYGMSSCIGLGNIIGVCIGGAVSTTKGLINNYNKFNRNILDKINDFNKNKTNIEVGSGEWSKLLKENSIDEIVNKVNFNRFSIQHYLNNLKNEFGLTFDEICEKSNYKDSYIKAVFSLSDRKRNPNRDCIIGLSFAFELNTYETNYLLKAAGFNELYLRDKRDLIIAKALIDSIGINQLNNYLDKYGCDKIGNLDKE